MASLEQDIKTSRFTSQYQKLVVNLIFTGNRISQAQQSFFKPFGLSTAQYNVMRILRGNHPNPHSVNDIIDRMLDPMSNASRIVDKLEAKELVMRRKNSDDRRAVDVLITGKGLSLLGEIDLALENNERVYNAFTNDELKLVNDFLDRFRENL